VYTFAILGPMAKKPGPAGVAILEAMAALEKHLLRPFLFIQPVSGVLLIFATGLNLAFFSHYWLWVAILLYAVAFSIGLFIQIPLVERLPMLAADLKGPPGPEFLALVKRSQTVGPVLTVILSVIIILMVTKPGA
ncbi:MAG TPA: DUF2269 family protein, partial [Candidatus Limnocylindria bacterium]